MFDGSASRDPNGLVVRYAWGFGDGAKGAGRKASHGFSTAGRFVVTLTVWDDSGVASSTRRTLTIR
jgi:large repetitive protein